MPTVQSEFGKTTRALASSQATNLQSHLSHSLHPEHV